MEWIKVDDRLPEPGVWVLVYRCVRWYDAEVAQYRVPPAGHGFYTRPFWRMADDNAGDATDVTHWMPMPEPPTSHPPAHWVRRDGYKELVVGTPADDDDVLSSHLSVKAAWAYTNQ